MSSPFAATIGRSLPGPVLVVGASGFVGANLLRQLLAVRSDIYGTFLRSSPWRLRDVPATNQMRMDLQNTEEVLAVLSSLHPRTVFYCAAYGAYSFQTDASRILRTNIECLQVFVDELVKLGDTSLIHAGSSSEYGTDSAGPIENGPRQPNSTYAISKSAASDLLAHAGRTQNLRCANLRLYSVYGPYEDASRLISTLSLHGIAGRLPPMAEPRVSRDFIHVDDVISAFIAAASNLPKSRWGEAFNIGTGRKTTIAEIAELARRIFSISAEPAFGEVTRSWDLQDWYADPSKAIEVLGWTPKIQIESGLRRTAEWWKNYTAKGFNPETLSETQRHAGRTISVIT